MQDAQAMPEEAEASQAHHKPQTKIHPQLPSLTQEEHPKQNNSLLRTFCGQDDGRKQGTGKSGLCQAQGKIQPSANCRKQSLAQKKRGSRTRPAQNCCPTGVWATREAGANFPAGNLPVYTCPLWQYVHNPSMQPLPIMWLSLHESCPLWFPQPTSHLDLSFHGPVKLDGGRLPNPQHQAGVWCSTGTKHSK